MAMINFDTVIQDKTFNSLYRRVHSELIMKGIRSKPRGMEVYELLNCTLILENPRHRLLESAVRKHNYSYACGEFFWYLRGSNSVDEIAFYLERMRDFSDDGKTLRSAYGERIFGKHPDFPNQWANVIANLCKDKDSRQAVINVNYSHDLGIFTKDVPCTLNLQFFIRDNKLNLIVRMRSNDSYMGLIYDVFSFTLFQEMMFNTLKIYYPDLELGTYVHNAGSMHLYARDEEGAMKVINEHTGALGQVAISNEQLMQLSMREVALREKNQVINKKGLNTTFDWIAEKLNRQLR